VYWRRVSCALFILMLFCRDHARPLGLPDLVGLRFDTALPTAIVAVLIDDYRSDEQREQLQHRVAALI
jgi:hypothetical protein